MTGRRGRDTKQPGCHPHVCGGYECTGISQLQMFPPCWAPQSRASVPGRGAPIIPGCENQKGFGLSTQKAAGDPGVLLKGPHGLTGSQALSLDSGGKTVASWEWGRGCQKHTGRIV